MWLAFLVISASLLIGSIVFAIISAKAKYKSGRILDPLRAMFLGVILSSVLIFIPIYINTYKTTEFGVLQTVLVAVHNMLGLFVVNGDMEFITSNLSGVAPYIFSGYTILSGVLFVMAPVLTFSFVLTFFKNASAQLKYITAFRRDVYVFSGLNEKSVSLAASLHSEKKKALLVFADVFNTNNNLNPDLVEKAKELSAVLFDKDVLTLNLSFHSKKSTINLFAISDDESENVSLSLKLIDKFSSRDNTDLYVFSASADAELLLANAFNKYDATNPAKIKVRRINSIRSLLSRNLYDKGFEYIFDSSISDGNVKQINAVVVGMGQYGTEMVKMLSWFCQMDGYSVRIDSFDADVSANDKFCALCPELMDEKHNGVDIDGEPSYKITIHSGIDVDTKAFCDAVMSMPDTTYVLVALGDDEKNISVAAELRAMFKRLGCTPRIQTVVYSTDKKQALCGITNFKGQSYDIDFIGDIATSYSTDVVMNSDVEQVALQRHLKWGAEEEFWKYDYNYNSSIASAIHQKMKKLCNVDGITESPHERSEEQLWNIRRLEHNRWNAYMRSEGYVYGGTTDKAGRDDLAKTHNCLVPFDELPLKEQEKDDD